MRSRLVVATAIVTLSLIVAPSTANAAGANSVTAKQTVQLSKDGVVTISGTYRCSDDDPTGAVLLSSTLQQGETSQGVGGSVAKCDGQEHEWKNSAQVAHGAVAPGPAWAGLALMKMKVGDSVIPAFRFLAVNRQAVTVVAS